jgi:small conductance mechanosensitive channel
MNEEQIQMWLEQGVTMATDFGPRVLGVVVIFILGKWFAGKFAKLGRAGMDRAKVDTTLAAFFESVIRYAILTVAGLAALDMFGIETTSFVAVLGAMGFAVGLAMQGTLANFSAGVMLLLFRPYNLGDVVEGGGSIGEVVSLNLFTTVLQPPSGELITVPNGAIFGGTITNYTHGKLRMVAVDVGVDYGADLDTARKVLIEAMEKIDGVEKVVVFLMGLGASSVDFQLRCWANPDLYWDLMDEMGRTAKYALDGAGIGIPYQTVDVNLIKGE